MKYGYSITIQNEKSWIYLGEPSTSVTKPICIGKERRFFLVFGRISKVCCIELLELRETVTADYNQHQLIYLNQELEKKTPIYR